MFYDFVEIGTSDFDTLIQRADDRTIGLSVDPIKLYLDRLPQPRHCSKLAAAISDHDGETVAYYIPPERIEAGWWDGQLVTRDYFVAEGKDHTCYWIFQERMGSREGDESRWYLHGLFG